VKRYAQNISELMKDSDYTGNTFGLAAAAGYYFQMKVGVKAVLRADLLESPQAVNRSCITSSLIISALGFLVNVYIEEAYCATSMPLRAGWAQRSSLREVPESQSLGLRSVRFNEETVPRINEKISNCNARLRWKWNAIG
jgi:hypothetical protein